jgi:hypothetical protein
MSPTYVCARDAHEDNCEQADDVCVRGKVGVGRWKTLVQALCPQMRAKHSRIERQCACMHGLKGGWPTHVDRVIAVPRLQLSEKNLFVELGQRRKVVSLSLEPTATTTCVTEDEGERGISACQ